MRASVEYISHTLSLLTFITIPRNRHIHFADKTKAQRGQGHSHGVSGKLAELRFKPTQLLSSDSIPPSPVPRSSRHHYLSWFIEADKLPMWLISLAVQMITDHSENNSTSSQRVQKEFYHPPMGSFLSELTGSGSDVYMKRDKTHLFSGTVL